MSSGSTSLLAYPDFNWWGCFWILSMVGTSRQMKKLLEIFCNSWTNSGRLPLSYSGATESTKLVRLKYFLNKQRFFKGGYFPRAGFKADSCF